MVPKTNREREGRVLVPLVCEVFWRHKQRYGARLIAEELKDQGKQCGVARVAKLLKNQGLRAIQPKSFKPKTTDSRHTLGYSPNLLLNRAATTQINEVVQPLANEGAELYGQVVIIAKGDAAIRENTVELGIKESLSQRGIDADIQTG